ncbi:MAG: carboxypeptidase regulatory-like domain-containing protein [Thermoplasmatales archaeon]|nr:carboxypeptidase regulatory-like domain-containing protein [Thermoplasmatales archaeon]
MKKLAVSTIILLLFIILEPCINGTLLKGGPINEESGDYGRVSGSVFIHSFPPPTYIVGAKLVLEGDYFKRTTYIGVLGGFRFNFVPVGRQYTLTVTHPKFKTVIETFTLSPDDPDFRISIAMMDKDKVRSRITSEEQTKVLGSIYGYTGVGYIWGFSPVRFAKVQAGGKTIISGPIMGEYRIRGLPIGTYTVIGTKKGYDIFTDTVTLTERYPDKQVFVDLEPNDKSVETKGKTGLFTSTKICSNTRSNFLSAFTFMP